VSKRLSVIIPAYNEEATIGEVIELIYAEPLEPLGLDKELIVVDDGSTDQTAAIVENLATRYPNLNLLRHARNEGKGAAIQTALPHVSGDYVIIQDADLEGAVHDYQHLLPPLLEGRCQVVFGSRFLKSRRPPGMHWANLAANRILTGTANLLFPGRPISDQSCVYKVFETPLLRSLNLKTRRFEFCAEVTAKLRRRGIEIVEVPIDYAPRDIAAGKKIRWRDGFSLLGTLIRLRFWE